MIDYTDVPVTIDSIQFYLMPCKNDRGTKWRLADKLIAARIRAIKLFQELDKKNPYRTLTDDTTKIVRTHCKQLVGSLVPQNAFSETNIINNVPTDIIYLNYRTGDFMIRYHIFLKYDTIFMMVNQSLQKIAKGSITDLTEYDAIEAIRKLYDHARRVYLAFMESMSPGINLYDTLYTRLARLDIKKDIFLEDDRIVERILEQWSQWVLPGYKKNEKNEYRSVHFNPAKKGSMRIRKGWHKHENRYYDSKYELPALSIYNKRAEINRTVRQKKGTSVKLVEQSCLRYEQQFYRDLLKKNERMDKIRRTFEERGEFPPDFKEVLNVVFEEYDVFKGKVQVQQDRKVVQKMIYRHNVVVPTIKALMSLFGLARKRDIVDRSGLTKNEVTGALRFLEGVKVVERERRIYYRINREALKFFGKVF